MTEKFENSEIPFKIIGNRQCLTAFQLMEMPYLKELITRFPSCFESGINQEVVFFYPDGTAALKERDFGGKVT